MKIYRLWEGDAPGAKGTEDKDIPALIDYGKPNAKPQPAIIVCPGGGYHVHADHEGAPIAHFLESMGVRAPVLRYRLFPYQHPCMINDIHRAIRYIRAHSMELGVDSKRVGVLGFSAGGHLCSMAATLHDKGNPDSVDVVETQSCRPDVAALVYPVITLVGPHAHMGSRQALLGKDATDQQALAFSSERNVSLDTSPCFLVHTSEDRAVPPQNSLLMAQALADHRVPFCLHLMEKGPHGFGTGTPGGDLDWRPALVRWLEGRGFLKG